MWREIQEALPPLDVQMLESFTSEKEKNDFLYSRAYMFSTIVCRVFRRKIQELRKTISDGKLFGAKPVYLVRVMEVQKRGLPHCHIALRLNGQQPEIGADIDRIIRADIPKVPQKEDPENADQTIDDVDHKDYNSNIARLRDLVVTHMIHKHHYSPGGCAHSPTKDEIWKRKGNQGKERKKHYVRVSSTQKARWRGGYGEVERNEEICTKGFPNPISAQSGFFRGKPVYKKECRGSICCSVQCLSSFEI